MHIESSPIMLDNGDLIWDGIQYDITDRIRAEQEREKLLAEAIAARTEASTARDMLASVFERMNDGIVALDNQLHYTYLNKNGAALLGRTPEQLIRKYIWAEFPEGIGQPFYHAYYQALKEQKPIYIEDYYAPWDRWFENRIYPSADGLTIYFTDISDRKKAELQRLESEKLKLELNLLEKILNIVLAGYWDWDMVNHTSYMSPRLKRMFGYNDDELPNVPETWQNLIFPEDLPPTLQCFEQHVKSHGEIPYYNEVRYRHKNGSTVWVICSGQVIEWDEMGNPLRIIGCHVDITTRKNAEAALQESEARFRYLADNAPVLIWMSGLDKLYFHFNKGWLEFTGRTLAQEMGNGWTQGLHPDDFQFCLDTYSQAFERREKFAMEYRLKRHDGEYRWLLDTGVPRFDANGEFVGYIGSCVDIGDRKQVEEEIQQKTRQLEATNKELESFSYSVSHDLRAPLRHINGFVNALRQQLEQNSALKDEKVARYLEVIESSSQKMAQLIDGLLTLSRIGRRDMEFQALNLREIVEDVLSLTQITDNYATSVEFIIGDLPNITGDATLLKQVFTNLISNAVKFSRNHPTPLVEIGSLSDQTIFVKDNGAGFSMDYADKLFGAFQRLHSQKEFEGTGIGLAIAQRIIARHGGLIWAESKVNHGATFYFKIN